MPQIFRSVKSLAADEQRIAGGVDLHAVTVATPYLPDVDYAAQTMDGDDPDPFPFDLALLDELHHAPDVATLGDDAHGPVPEPRQMHSQIVNTGRIENRPLRFFSRMKPRRRRHTARPRGRPAQDEVGVFEHFLDYGNQFAHAVTGLSVPAIFPSASIRSVNLVTTSAQRAPSEALTQV